jgi:hypothetical protein
VIDLPTLIRRLDEIGATLRLSPFTRKPEALAAKDPELRAEFDKLLPDLARLKPEITELLALRCPRCKRNTTDPEDVERLKGINPFCGEIGCPYRNR